jgi:hypothetical protein
MQRNPEFDDETTAGSPTELEFTVVSACNGRGDAQAKTKAATCTTRTVSSLERLQQLRNAIFGNAGTAVADLNASHGTFD